MLLFLQFTPIYKNALLCDYVLEVQTDEYTFLFIIVKTRR